MKEPVNDRTRIVAMDGLVSPVEDLPYLVELWDLPRLKVERVLARAATASLARAIFQAALTEHLGRYIVLRRAGKVISESP